MICCKDCKHWDRKDTDVPCGNTEDGYTYENRWGIAGKRRCALISESTWNDELGAEVASWEDGDLLTGPEFGCVLGAPL